MRRQSIQVVGLAITAMLLALGVQSSISASSPKDEGKVCIGTFERSALLVAYYKSSTHAEALTKLTMAREEADKAGNKDRVKEIEAEGGALQELAHQQLAGQAELTNIHEHLKPALAEVAKKANVSLIIEKPWFSDESIELVDITNDLVDKLPPAKKSKG